MESLNALISTGNIIVIQKRANDAVHIVAANHVLIGDEGSLRLTRGEHPNRYASVVAKSLDEAAVSVLEEITKL